MTGFSMFGRAAKPCAVPVEIEVFSEETKREARVDREGRHTWVCLELARHVVPLGAEDSLVLYPSLGSSPMVV